MGKIAKKERTGNGVMSENIFIHSQYFYPNFTLPKLAIYYERLKVE